jgi:hypothetical protein
MTRLAIIFSLLFATPAWAERDPQSKKIVLEGDIIATEGLETKKGFWDLLVSYEGNLYHCFVVDLRNGFTCWYLH